MKYSTHILSLLFFLLLIPSSKVLACGSSIEKSKIDSITCSSKVELAQEKACCDSEKNQDDEGCGGSCSNNSCHCPVLMNTPIFVNSLELSVQNNYSVVDLDWTYIQRIPKTVYLPMWQRPKIG